MSIGKHDGSRPVPRFHHAAEEFVERTLARGHGLVLLPCFRHHHHDGFLKRPAIEQQKLQDVVKGTGIATKRFNNRKQLFQFIAIKCALSHSLTCLHPIDVATQGVNFAVVAHESQRLCAVPTREGVG